MRGFEAENCSETAYQPMPRRKQVDVVKRQVSCGTFLAAASRDLSQLFYPKIKTVCLAAAF